MKMVFVSYPTSGFDPVDIRETNKIIDSIKRNEFNTVVRGASCFKREVHFVEEDGKTSMRNSNFLLIRTEELDEIWLFGDRIDDDMKNEIHLAYAMGTRIVPKTEATRIAFEKLNLIQKDSKEFWNVIGTGLLWIILIVAVYFAVKLTK